MTLRVGIVSPYDLSIPGGVQNQVAGLAAALERVDVEVDVLAPLGPQAEPVVDIGAARLIRLGRTISVSVNGSRAPVAPFPSTMTRAVRRLRSGNYDVVHLHEPFVPGPALAGLVATKVPIVGTFHRSGVDVAYRALGVALGRLAGHLDARVAVSEQARDTAVEVLGRHAGSVEVLWNGVDVTRIRAAEPIGSGSPTIVFVGRHEERKGLGVLLTAFSKLDAPARLWVCSTGPLTETLRREHAADDRIEWLGRVSDDELVRRLRGADVLCAPAIGGESFGLVVAEGLAASICVVASDIPGYRSALAGAGVLVPPGDAGSLAAALDDVLSDPKLRADLVARGDVRAQELSIDRLAERYLELYRQVAAA
jgi:phosphatidylinositol alpha-mannosyltransferase